MTTWLIATLICCSDGAADTASIPVLIDRLGSPRYADRRAASDALSELGREALGQLRSARKSADAEVQNRIEGVIDRIERERLHAATPVLIPKREYPTGSFLRALEEQVGFPIERERGDRSDWLTRKLTWDAEEALPFWTALERAGIDGTWIIDRDTAPFRSRPVPVFTVSERRAGAQSSITGPFRFALRDVRLVPKNMGGRRALVPGRSAKAGDDAALIELQIELACEPRLQIRPNGSARLTDAVDDRGASLMPAGSSAINTVDPWLTHEPVMALSAQLELPTSRPGQIARVSGVVPVEVQTRRIEPIEIPVDEGVDGSSHAPIWCGDVTFVSCRVADGPLDGAMVELVIQPEGWSQLSPLMFRRRFRGGNSAEQLVDTIERVVTNLEIVDAEGRTLPHGPARPMRPMPDGLSVVLPVNPPAKAGMPRRVLYHATLRETIPLEFEFRDVPTKLPTAGR